MVSAEGEGGGGGERERGGEEGAVMVRTVGWGEVEGEEL